jgi:hypothetical protein
MDTLSLQRILIDGSLLSLTMGIIILGSLRYNPRLWLQDYPKEIREKVPPLTAQEKRQQRLLVVPFFLVMIGIPLGSTYLLRMESGGSITFLTAYLHTFLVANFFNLFDAVVLDFLILALIQPKFAALPGTEDMGYLYRDWGMHVRNYLKGIIVCGVLSAPIAFVATL